MKKALSVREAAAETGKTERAIWQDIYRGRFPHRRWGKRVIILRDDLDEFLKSLPGKTAQEALTKAAEAN